MKTGLVGRYVVVALLALGMASAGCKRGAQDAVDGNGEGIGGPLDGQYADTTDLSGEEFRMTGEGETAAAELQTVYFDFDEAAIRSDQQPVLDQNVRYLMDNPAVRIQIEGHCDERGTVPYNFALGDARAKSVKNYLASRGVDAARMTTISKGEEEPAVMGTSEAAYAQNRRAEFIFAN